MTTVFCDTETGGVLPQHPTIQLAAVAMDGDVELATFEQCITFDIGAADPAALAMNHYDAARWAREAVTPAVCASRFAAWLRPYSTVEKVSKAGKPYRVARWSAYNVPFDEPRIRALFGTQFCPLEFLARDVLQRVLFYFDESGETAPENFKLSTVAARFGLSTESAHDALADARMAARVYAAVRGAW